MSGFSHSGRRVALERSAQGIVDVLVVGAGITGAGVAREAALRGFSVAVLDRGDLASGTSSRSSKLVHGGIRYLAQGELGLVREAARERARLHRMAPHLVRPLSMLIPAASQAGKLKLAAGLWTFEKLRGTGNDHYLLLDRPATLAAEGGLRRERFAGAVCFNEYVTNDARLVLETLQSAAAYGAWVANYAEIKELDADPAGMRATVVDLETGHDLVLRARVVVNAAGPWFDEIRSMARPQSKPVLQLTRGIHLVVPRRRLPVQHIVVLRAPDGRSTFVVPRGDYAYIGTTDTLYSGDPSEPEVTQEDVSYLLAAVAATFEDPPGPNDVVGTWSGVRPLLRQEGKQPSDISRRDEILSGPGPLLGITGGKLTTYRCMAERVIGRVVERLGNSPAGNIDSSAVPLFGGDLEQQHHARSRSPSLADRRLEQRLWQRYGTAAQGIVERLLAEPALAEPLDGDHGICLAEIDHAVDNEMVLRLDDLLRRRSQLGLLDVPRATACAGLAAQRLAKQLGWDQERANTEAEQFQEARRAELNTARATPWRDERNAWGTQGKGES